jgi:hypothetical protein
MQVISHTPPFFSLRSSLELLKSLRNIRRRLLHRVELKIPRHRPGVVSVLGHQLLQPLPLSFTLVSDFRRGRVLSLFDERLNYVRRANSIVINTTPFFGIGVLVFRLRIGINLVERVI